MTLTDLATPTTNPVPLSLPVVEAFGPTLQGEGPDAGRAAAFIRLGGCNLSCSWCDSPYTWDGGRYDLRDEITPTHPAQLLDQLPPVESAPLVILTGGEPLLHQDTPAWTDLLTTLGGQGREVHVETNGTRAPNATSAHHIDRFIVSPKLDNAGSHRGNQDPTLHPDWAATSLDAHLKVVVTTTTDVDMAVTLADTYQWPHTRLWVMPEGTSTATLASRWPTIATAAARRGINACHRLHVLAWGDERGT